MHHCHRDHEHCTITDDELLEIIMGDTSKLATAVTALIARNTELTAENAALKAAGDDDQAAIDSLTNEVDAALPPAAPVTEPIPAEPTNEVAGDTPLADETQAVLDQAATS